ncbi:MAG: hypothetical protein ACFB03_01940 [Paracoccaceae bacterium]
MPVYIANEVAAVCDLHPYLGTADFRALPIREQIAQQARTVHAGHKAGDRRIAMHVCSWWPDARHKAVDDVMRAEFTYADAALTMSHEYGFADWDAVEALGDLCSEASFESALDDVLAGDIEALDLRLTREPQLVTARSRYGHRSTLLHYVGANGVESHRQRMPMNAPDVARVLLSHGASIAAKANMYGGGQTPYALASTSAHPHGAGIAEDLNLVLSGE